MLLELVAEARDCIAGPGRRKSDRARGFSNSAIGKATVEEQFARHANMYAST